MHHLFTTLLLPLLGAVQAAPATTPAPTVPCTQRFTGWTISDFEYHASYIFSTPAHQNSHGYVSFNLANSAVDYVVPCSATSNQLSDFFYGTTTYSCQVPEASGGAVTFTYARPGGTLAVNQTWYCVDDPKWPARFNAGGQASVQLECTDTTTKNDNWTMGQIYSSRIVDCQPVELPMKADWVNAVA